MSHFQPHKARFSIMQRSSTHNHGSKNIKDLLLRPVPPLPPISSAPRRKVNISFVVVRMHICPHCRHWRTKSKANTDNGFLVKAGPLEQNAMSKQKQRRYTYRQLRTQLAIRRLLGPCLWCDKNFQSTYLLPLCHCWKWTLRKSDIKVGVFNMLPNDGEEILRKLTNKRFRMKL